MAISNNIVLDDSTLRVSEWPILGIRANLSKTTAILKGFPPGAMLISRCRLGQGCDQRARGTDISGYSVDIPPWIR